MTIGKHIIAAAIENGASLAGIANMEALKASASHTMYHKMKDYAGIVTAKDDEALPDNQVFTDGEAPPDDQLFTWPDSVGSVLVIGLLHPEDKPEG